MNKIQTKSKSNLNKQVLVVKHFEPQRNYREITKDFPEINLDQVDDDENNQQFKRKCGCSPPPPQKIIRKVVPTSRNNITSKPPINTKNVPSIVTRDDKNINQIKNNPLKNKVIIKPDRKNLSALVDSDPQLNKSAPPQVENLSNKTQNGRDNLCFCPKSDPYVAELRREISANRSTDFRAAHEDYVKKLRDEILVSRAYGIEDNRDEVNRLKREITQFRQQHDSLKSVAVIAAQSEFRDNLLLMEDKIGAVKEKVEG